MTAPLMAAAAMQMTRDELWRNPPPLAADCEHALELLPVIEARFTVLCRNCGGLDAGTSRRMTREPGRFILGPDSSVRERLDPPGREWAIRHPGGKITVQIDGHAFPGRITAERELPASADECEWCDGGPHALVYRDRQAWREA